MVNNGTKNNNNKKYEDLVTKIKNEKGISNKCLIDIERHWKKVLSDEKLESLKEELVTLKEKCIKETKQKKDLIQTLLISFDHVEDEQYRVSVASNLQTIDEMIQMHDAMLCKMERDFNDKFNKLRNEYEAEKQMITNKFECDKYRILNEIKSIETEEKRLVNEHNREQQQAIEEIKNKNLEDVNSLRFVLDTKIEDLDEQFEISKNEYIQKTDVQSETLQKQVEKDREMSKEMISLQCQIDKLCASTKRLKSVSRRNSSQNMERNRQLMERKNEDICRYKDTKANIEELRSSRYGKLKALTKQANTCKSNLQKECDLIERILKLIQLTKKMETREDKKEQEQEQLSSKTQGTEIFNTEGIWRRYNNVIIDLHSLKEEEKKQMKRNDNLKEKLRQYQDGVTVNDRVINSHNPLIVINGKMRPESRECLSKCSHSTSPVGLTVIDANHFPITHAR